MLAFAVHRGELGNQSLELEDCLSSAGSLLPGGRVAGGEFRSRDNGAHRRRNVVPVIARAQEARVFGGAFVVSR